MSAGNYETQKRRLVKKLKAHQQERAKWNPGHWSAEAKKIMAQFERLENDFSRVFPSDGFWIKPHDWADKMKARQ